MRRVILAVAVTALFAGPTALSFFSGGYFDPPRLVAGAVAWLLVLIAVVAAPPALPHRRPGRLALGGLALFTAWTAIATGWAPLYATATQAVQRDLLYLGALIAAAALLRRPRAARAAEPALAAGAAIIIGYGLSERLLPGVIHLSHSSAALGRLEQPLTYWNATGALAALGAVLCVRLAGDASRPVPMRALAGAATAPLAVGVWLSFSRGAQAALGVGVIALLAATLTREQLRALLAVAPGAAVAVIAANGFDGVRALDGTRSAREADGLAMLAILFAACAFSALAVWLCARREATGRWSAGGWRRPRWVAAGAALAVVLSAAAVVAFAARDSGHAAASGATAARLTSLESNRYAYWRIAIKHGFAAHPLRGIGPGGFEVIWLRYRNIGERTRVAHSLYVQTLAELGVVGLALLAAFLAGLGASAWRARRLAGLDAAGPIAALVVWLVHSAVDWDWEMPALTLFALVLGGLLIAAGDRSRVAAAAAPSAAREPAPNQAVPA